MTGFLSKIRLKRQASVQAMAQLFRPSSMAEQYQTAHHMLWSVFSDSEERKRDFLWRQMAPGEFITLSQRAAENHHDLFDIESKPFNISLKEGDKLQFHLRVNATITRQEALGKKSKRHDVVMDALRFVEKEQRPVLRAEKTFEALQEWFDRCGEKSGFSREDLFVTKHDVLRIARPGKGAKISFGIADLTGRVCVTDPTLFLPRLIQGFGRSKAFGCGLMLVKRPSL